MIINGISVINISGKIKRKQYEYVFNEIMKKRDTESKMYPIGWTRKKRVSIPIGLFLHL